MKQVVFKQFVELDTSCILLRGLSDVVLPVYNQLHLVVNEEMYKTLEDQHPLV